MSIEAFKRQLEELNAEYRRALPGKLARIDALWSEMTGEPARADRLAVMQRELHSIAGSARTFGIAGVSEAAAAAESFLEPCVRRGKLPAAAGRVEFERLLDSLRKAAG